MNRLVYLILLVVGVGFIIMPISVPVFKSTAPYSVINTGKNGTSDFGKLLYHAGHVSVILGPYDSAGLSKINGTLVVIGPNLPFSTGEVKSLENFLVKGNVLLLADNFGTGRSLLRALGVNISISNRKVLTLTMKDGIPFTAELVPNLSINCQGVYFRDPAEVLGVPGKDVLVYTSNASKAGNRYGPFPLVVKLSYGRGTIVFISDPSIFTNNLFQLNEPFLRNLIGILPNRNFYIDEAHHTDLNPYSGGSIVIHRAVNRKLVFYYVLVIASLAVFIESGMAGWLISSGVRVITFLLTKIFGSGEESVEELVEKLSGEGLDKDKLKTLLRELETGSRLGDAYGRRRIHEETFKGT